MQAENGLKKFTGSSFGDGSSRQGMGWRAARAAFSIVQMVWNQGNWRIHAAAIGPAVGWIQTVPLAELLAATFFVCNCIDAPDIIFHSDCKWVVSGMRAGACATTGAAMVHADVWRKLHRANDMRKWPILPDKVKAHVTKEDVRNGYSNELRVGNGLADAGAKLALSMHEVSENEAETEAGMWHTVQTAVKFLARITDAVWTDNNDCKAEPRRSAYAENLEKDKLIITCDSEHIPVRTGDGFMCVRCNKRARSEALLDRIDCRLAKAHSLWRTRDLVMCRQCGAYSISRANI